MKVARFYGPKDIRVEQVPEPITKPDQIKIKVAWNGICGTDLHLYLSGFPEAFSSNGPHPVTGETLPITLGHEFSGTITELGTGVDHKKFNVGQNVCVEPVLSCMQKDRCLACNDGTRNLCSSLGFIGVHGGGGGLAEYITVDQNLVYVLPKGTSLEAGACMEPLAVAWHAVKLSGYTKGNTALIIGAGPIGLFILKVLRAIDPVSTVIVSEPTLLRRERAQAHGATLAVNPLESNLHAATLGATNNRGVDIAFDAAGFKESINTAMLCLRPRGLVMNVAVWEFEPTINMNLMVMKEVKVTSSISFDRVHPELLEAIAAGKITNIEDLITSKIGIEDVVEEGFEKLLNERDKQVKILVHP